MCVQRRQKLEQQNGAGLLSAPSFAMVYQTIVLLLSNPSKTRTKAITEARKFDSATKQLFVLHWLPVKKCPEYRALWMCHKITHKPTVVALHPVCE